MPLEKKSWLESPKILLLPLAITSIISGVQANSEDIIDYKELCNGSTLSLLDREFCKKKGYPVGNNKPKKANKKGCNHNFNGYVGNYNCKSPSVDIHIQNSTIIGDYGNIIGN